VAPPRIAASPVALECATMAIHDLPTGNMIILAEVLALQIDSAMLLDVERCYVDTPALDLIGRMHGGGWYSHTRDRFEMPRLKPDQLPTTRRQDNKAGGED
jgi:flavin reductase (DIM6/NTAB) family NADH-FMN oxidoreductase RutF